MVHEILTLPLVVEYNFSIAVNFTLLGKGRLIILKD
jgi:hypothetical protein